MLADHAGAPEARCLICDIPLGFNDENHPNFKHWLYVELAVLEYRFGLFMRRIKGWF